MFLQGKNFAALHSCCKESQRAAEKHEVKKPISPVVDYYLQ